MAFSRENMRRVSEILAHRRAEAEHTAERNLKRVYEKNPAVKEIDTALSKTGLELVRIALSKTDVRSSLARVKEENLALQKKRRLLLSEMGLSADYTDVKYTCPVCSDTGYTEKGMCVCMRRLLTEEGFRSSGLGGLIEKQSFANFSLHFYKDGDLEAVSRALDAAKAFAEDFDKTHASLLFIGGTGLGKTHLSTAIARRAIERGQDVVYETAQNIIADFEYDRFRRGFDEAEKWLTEFDKMDATFRVPLYRGVLEWHRGNKEEAYRILEALCQQYPDRWNLPDQVADYLARDGRYDESIQWHRKALAVAKPPRYVDPIISIAQILELQGDFTGAIAAREEELEMYKTEWNFTEGETADAVRRDIARLKSRM